MAMLLVLAVIFWQDRKFRSSVLVFAVFFLALWRYGFSLPHDLPQQIWHYNGSTVSLKGVIDNEPDIRETNQKLELKITAVKDLPSDIRGQLLVTTDLYPQYGYGDELELECELQKPEKVNDFAYDRYLARYDIYSLCYYPKIKSTGINKGNAIYKTIFNFKNKLCKLIDYGLTEPESSLARPIILGGQKGLSEDLKQKFSQLGLTHILAVSGFNISIIAAIAMNSLLAIGISRKKAFYFSVAFLMFYVALVGAPASAMRAGLMGFLVLWAFHLGRLGNIANSILFAASLLLFINPRLLRDDVGFQLSFLAVLGIVYVFPVLVKLLEKINLKSNAVVDAMLVTIAAQVFTLPILVYNFSLISLIAPLANMLILWTLPILTIFIFVALPLGFAIPALAPAFYFPSLVLIKYILIAVELVSKIPFGYMEISYLWWGWAVAYYIAAVYLIRRLNCKLA